MEMFLVCPKCKNENLDYGDWNYESECAWQVVSCPECDFGWNEVYKFSWNESQDNCIPLDENGDEIK